MRLASSANRFSLSRLILLILTCSYLHSWASPIHPPALLSLSRAQINGRNAFPGTADVDWNRDAHLLPKRGEHITMNAMSGWTMKFTPYGMFLPLHSMFLIFEKFYQDAIGRAIAAEVAGLPNQNIVRIVHGYIGKQSAGLMLLPQNQFTLDNSSALRLSSIGRIGLYSQI